MSGTKTNPTNGLTQKQKAAADHYLMHGNKANAYRHAYNCSRMKKITSAARATELFQHPNVMRYIDEVRQKATSKAAMTQEEAINILSEMGRGKLSEFLNDAGEVDPVKVAHAGYSLHAYDVAWSEAGPSRKVKMRDPIQAIKLLADMLGWNAPQKHEHSGGINFYFNTNPPPEDSK